MALLEETFELYEHVKKIGGDYTFEGIVVSVFNKVRNIPENNSVALSKFGITVEPDLGPVRYVVQDDRGVLHIYSGKNLERL